jgi:Cu-Zn family superoxide dismutase
MNTLIWATSALLLGAAATATGASAPLTATAKMMDATGKSLGTITLTETAKGVLIKANLTGLPVGAHAFHIHAVGKCEAPFTSAGGHFNPTNAHHGFGPEGMHAGDMTNIDVPASGAAEFEVLNAMVTLEPGKPNSLKDADGSAIVLHAGADDYMSDPAGNAGARIACGVIE